SCGFSARVRETIANANFYHLGCPSSFCDQPFSEKPLVNSPLAASSSSHHFVPDQPRPAASELPASLFTLVLVVVIHASALGFVFYASGAKEPEIVELPRVQGILLPA